MTAIASETTAVRRRLTLFIGGQMLSLLGDGFAILAIPLVVLELTRNPLAAALSAAPRAVGYLAVGVFAGAFVDRLNPKRVMLVADLIRLSVFLLLALLLRFGELNIVLVLCLALVAAAAGVFFECALNVAVKDAFPEQRLVRVNALLETANQSALVVGPAIVGLLAATLGLFGALLVDAATFLVSLATIVGIRLESRGIERLSRNIRLLVRGLRKDLGEGFKFIHREPTIRSLTALQVAINFLLASENLLVLFLRDQLHLSLIGSGVVVAAGGAGGVAGVAAAPMLARRVGAAKLVLYGLMISCLGICLVGLSSLTWSLALCNALLAGGASCATVLIRTLRQIVVPREILGRVTGTARVLTLAANPVGSIAAGAAVGLIGGNLRVVFVGAGILGFLATQVAWRGPLNRTTPEPVGRRAHPAMVANAD